MKYNMLTNGTMTVLKYVLVRAISEESKCSDPMSKGKHTSYNLAAKLDP
jgi:hypothetical protein